MRHLPLLLALTLFCVGLIRDTVDDWIDATVLPPLDLAHSVEVTGHDGTLLRAFTVGNGLWRLRTSLEGVSPLYLAMLKAYEDQRFDTHAGVDPRAILRAMGQAVAYGEVVSGASTLTMQTARLLENSGTGALPGKLRQIRVAQALERRLSKGQILTLYLNRAPFGGNIEGLRSATRAWFGKDPARLTPAEAALLIALPQSPEATRPDRAPDTARTARNRVLARALAAGVIDTAAHDAALRAPIPTARRPVPSLAPHLTVRAVAEAPGVDHHQLTIEADLQANLERLARAALRGQDRHVTAAILVADHTTGAIRAHIGNAAPGSEARQGWVDMSLALRSPGSTLKPLVYALAFDQGLAHPETLIDDTPARFDTYAPTNFDGTFRGTLRVREALQASRNIPAVRLAHALGPASLVQGLRRAGLRPAFQGQPGLALALGGVGVRAEGLSALYAGFAQGGAAPAMHWRAGAGGARHTPFASDIAAWQIGHILSGLAPPVGAADLGIAYKTGTSYGHRDAWAVGYDSRHVVTVWMGRADGTPVPGAFGADTAAPVLFDVFARLGPVEPLGPPPPATLLVSTADLPAPLRRFGGREGEVAALDLTFPPNGAEIEGQAITARVRAGTPPFTWLAEGEPIATQIRRPDVALELPLGPVRLSVIDATGRAASAEVVIR